MDNGMGQAVFAVVISMAIFAGFLRLVGAMPEAREAQNVASADTVSMIDLGAE